MHVRRLVQCHDEWRPIFHEEANVYSALQVDRFLFGNLFYLLLSFLFIFPAIFFLFLLSPLFLLFMT